MLLKLHYHCLTSFVCCILLCQYIIRRFIYLQLHTVHWHSIQVFRLCDSAVTASEHCTTGMRTQTCLVCKYTYVCLHMYVMYMCNQYLVLNLLCFNLHWVKISFCSSKCTTYSCYRYAVCFTLIITQLIFCAGNFIYSFFKCNVIASRCTRGTQDAPPGLSLSLHHCVILYLINF